MLSLLLQLTRRLPLPGDSRREGAAVQLEEGKVWSVEGRPGTSVRCERGFVWLTQTGDGRDVILKAGDVFTCVRRGKIVVTALEKATLQMAAGDTPSPRRALRG